jgi:hypothetical protein
MEYCFWVPVITGSASCNNRETVVCFSAEGFKFCPHLSTLSNTTYEVPTRVSSPRASQEEQGSLLSVRSTWSQHGALPDNWQTVLNVTRAVTCSLRNQQRSDRALRQPNRDGRYVTTKCAGVDKDRLDTVPSPSLTFDK